MEFVCLFVGRWTKPADSVKALYTVDETHDYAGVSWLMRSFL
jgi:hypothetical protein